MSQDKQHDQTEATRAARPRSINGLLVFGLLFVGIYAFKSLPYFEAIACNDDIIASKPDVVMLGTQWCSYCARARRYFHDNEIHYCEYDIERTAEGKRRYEEIDGRSVPILIFGEKYRYNGYSEQVVERALAMLERDRGGDDQ